MLKRWLLKNTTGTKKRLIENMKNLREERAQNEPVPTKILASSSSGDQRPAKQPYKPKYSKEFIKIGFTCTLINDDPRPQCVVYSEVLANESLKVGKLKRHLTAKHSKFIDKPMSFFRRLEKELLSKKKAMTKHLTILERAQKASYEVAYLIPKDKNTTQHWRNLYQTCCYYNQSNYERRQGDRENKRNTIVC